MHQSAVHDFGTRRPGEVVFEVVRESVALPEGEGADVRRGLGEFSNYGVVDIDGLGQMADEGAEELLANAGGGPFNHCPKRVQVVGRRGGRHPVRPGRCRARLQD